MHCTFNYISETLTKSINNMAQFLGQVIGTKMNKTVKVCVTSLRLHPEILKVSVVLNLFDLA